MVFNVALFMLKKGILSEYLKYYNKDKLNRALYDKLYQHIINNFVWEDAGHTNWCSMYTILKRDLARLIHEHPDVKVVFILPMLKKQIKETDEDKDN